MHSEGNTVGLQTKRFILTFYILLFYGNLYFSKTSTGIITVGQKHVRNVIQTVYSLRFSSCSLKNNQMFIYIDKLYNSFNFGRKSAGLTRSLKFRIRLFIIALKLP